MNRRDGKHRGRDAGLRREVLRNIPADYIDLYPEARALERHFVLHLGPTNSGKTYDAMNALKEAGSGCYLGPLRLLAYEKYEEMNRDGYPCSLLTGEERYDVPGSLFTASTIEMLDMQKTYALAVIDEAQMLADPDRGGSWTAAILGVCAPEVHVCAAPSAEEILIRMIEECGDTYEIVRHERMTPLTCETTRFHMEQDTKKGDALIVFSRSSVHAVAAELHERGFKTSIIYGALPYDVRHEQARMFSEGETDVVVATDAIGMGMNLPIRRIVFLETEKFDGIVRRPLLPEEIKQIAGRAGRFGIYDEGFVTSEGYRKHISAGLQSEYEPVTEAVIDFPESLLAIQADLPSILEKWDQIRINPGYVRADTKRLISLCKMISDLSNDKQFLYRCIMLTFDEEDRYLLSHWKAICATEARGRVYPVRKYIPSEKKLEDIGSNLDELEEQFRLCDMLYNYSYRFKHPEFQQELMERKNQISERILKVLAREKLRPRRCRICGKKLPWNYPYALCERCFRRRYNR
ncbi:MAG: hypothetical protein IJL78_07495 [Lachnospiraceae bacterium]|nr:hypothetical protein [Lachnospiraceae bacterium]